MNSMLRKGLFLSFILLTNFTMSQSLTYLALGDSYTIGESVKDELRWPNQLAKQLEGVVSIGQPKIIATTGWTTDELMKGIVEANLEGQYDIVSLLIGVNNQYRGYPFAQYEKEFVELMEIAESRMKAGGTLFVVSIPDYGVTPFGQKKDPGKIGKELDEYNAYAKSVAEERGYPFFNITEISRKALEDSSLVAKDELHPSGKMYTQWVESMLPWMKQNFQSRDK